MPEVSCPQCRKDIVRILIGGGVQRIEWYEGRLTFMRDVWRFFLSILIILNRWLRGSER